jgi:hypothetical protein
MCGVLPFSACVSKWKKKSLLETIQGMREGRIKENDGKGEFNYDIL